LEISSSLGIETWGGGNRKQKRKPSKLAIITKISKITKAKSLDLTALSVADLETILEKATQEARIEDYVPFSRFKKPYVEVLSQLFPRVSLGTLPLGALRELLDAFTSNPI
jgi:hypothetical protein